MHSFIEVYNDDNIVGKNETVTELSVTEYDGNVVIKNNNYA
jgi:hypothetical protein